MGARMGPVETVATAAVVSFAFFVRRVTGSVQRR